MFLLIPARSTFSSLIVALLFSQVAKVTKNESKTRQRFSLKLFESSHTINKYLNFTQLTYNGEFVSRVGELRAEFD